MLYESRFFSKFVVEIKVTDMNKLFLSSLLTLMCVGGWAQNDLAGYEYSSTVSAPTGNELKELEEQIRKAEEGGE